MIEQIGKFYATVDDLSGLKVDRAGKTRKLFSSHNFVLGCCFFSLLENVAWAAETTTYVLTDNQGTVLAVEDNKGSTIAQFDYRPYGRQQSGPMNDGPGFTGHLGEPEAGMIYMQRRYYDPEAGRFLSVDPAGVKVGDFSYFNRFAYAANNPTKYIDPSGAVLVIVENPSAPHAGRHSMADYIAAAKADDDIAPIIKALEDSDKVNVIMPAVRGGNSTTIPVDNGKGGLSSDGKASGGTGTVIKIKLGREAVLMKHGSGDDKKSTEVPVKEKILHEGVHAVMFNNGTMPDKGVVDPVTSNPAAEQSAMDRENEWRQHQGLDGRRTQY